MENIKKITIFLIHGWDGSPTGDWFPWLKQKLEQKNYLVTAPAMPNPEHPKRDLWVNTLTKAISNPNENTILVGHSLGCITILRYLETLPENIKIRGAVLVAGFSESIGYDEINHFFSPPLNYGLVKNHCQKFVAIHSDNDPYVPLAQGTTLKEKIGAKLVVMANAGHIGAEDGFTALPAALNAIQNMVGQ